MKFGVIFGVNFLISIWKHDGGRGIDFHWNNLSAQRPYFLLFPTLGIFFFLGIPILGIPINILKLFFMHLF